MIDAVKTRADIFADKKFFLIARVYITPDIDIGRHLGISPTESARNGRAETWGLDAAREEVPGHHVVLRLEMNSAEFGLVCQAAENRAVIHDLGDVVQPFSDENSVSRSGNRSASAEQI